MMVLTGNVGKSVVLESILETHKNIYAIVYDKTPIATLDTWFLSSEEINIMELCKTLRREVGSDKSRRKELLVVYTNLQEADTFAIKDMVEELEQDGFCRYGIVMCKE